MVLLMQIDFIVNYDIKHRMSDQLNGGELGSNQ